MAAVEASAGHKKEPLGKVLKRVRLLSGRIAAAFAVLMFLAFASSAHAENRSLKLYFVHTGERATITFKRNGRFDADGLAKLNRFLRDWRRNEPTKMDPRLFDLIWTVYKQTGSSDYIHVLSAYRSPATNEMLRTRSAKTGVAKESQHMVGKAMDFYIPGFPLEKLRELGLKQQVGGVGYYPRSGSPFVHMDVGGVRAWPRASREVLTRLFPDGKTLHIPADGRPLPGYQAAMADYKRRLASGKIEVADIAPAVRPKNLFQILFGGGDEDEDSDAIATDSPNASPAKKQPEIVVASAAPEPKQQFIENLPGVGGANIVAPVPAIRPAVSAPVPNAPIIETAMVSPARNAAADAVEAVTTAEPTTQQFADLQQYVIPVPELLGERRLPGDAEIASVPVPDVRPDYQLVVADNSQPKKDELANLLQQMADSPTDGAIPVPAAASPSPAEKPTIVAALVPPKSANEKLLQALANAQTSSQAEFADIPVQPKKGARPSRADAVAASRMGVLKAPKLTGQLIAQWALSGKKGASIPRSPIAPDYYSATITEKPVAVYTAGFSAHPVKVDPARFSGQAVNFMNVKRFGGE